MERIAALIQAVAALLWPLVALYAFHRFAPEIKSLAARLRKGKVKVVHGRTASDDEILRAIDSGLRLLRALSALPRDPEPV